MQSTIVVFAIRANGVPRQRPWEAACFDKRQALALAQGNRSGNIGDHEPASSDAHKYHNDATTQDGRIKQLCETTDDPAEGNVR